MTPSRTREGVLPGVAAVVVVELLVAGLFAVGVHPFGWMDADFAVVMGVVLAVAFVLGAALSLAGKPLGRGLLVGVAVCLVLGLVAIVVFWIVFAKTFTF
ncbi:hypothetical protein [Labedaea rhizosphaerae]|uniref:Uncharacterized protein n=1 Tax=Labedaea rhizosphaerae TaxID=598644 RepID=A0A4R6SBC4_LABRH|nr:hypothetical protein [Labedaea rhizosphaerae]TDP96296.1 hypothetical protein EV186_104280 [Labedaea rhizosphaerae]